MRLALLVVVALWLTILYAYALTFSVIDRPASHTGSALICAEDMWCYNPLIQGNHVGTVPVFPGQPFRVTASYPQHTTGS